MEPPASDRSFPRTVLRAGLTGGIASGKTTVAEFLAQLGAFTLDADLIVHEMMAPGGQAVDEVVKRFGPGFLDSAGGIDRGVLGARVFADEASRRALNDIVHPSVRREIDRRIEEYRRAPDASPIVVVEAALLVETGRWREFDRLVVVRCGRETQIARLAERSGLTRSEAEARIDAQAPLADKLAVADYVIDTESGLDRTRRRTATVYRALLRDFERLHRA
jgi:dephospho-CoA kinase